MYFCKNCGEPYMTDEAVMCVKCGVAKGQGTNYCQNCGKPVAPNADVCLNCGVRVTNNAAPANAKSKMAAGLLGIFLGSFGVHNFYLGYTSKAVTQLVLSLIGILLSCFSFFLQCLIAISPGFLHRAHHILSATFHLEFHILPAAIPDKY